MVRNERESGHTLHCVYYDLHELAGRGMVIPNTRLDIFNVP